MIDRIRKTMKDKEQGFTLIELLVVIIIVGILAAIAIPVFLSQRKKGVDASLKSDLKNTATAIETIYTDNPTWVSATQYGPGFVPVNPDGSIGVGYQQNWSATTAAKIRLSPGNSVEVRANANGYCIKGYNASASAAVDETSAMAYDSTAGGMQPLAGYSGGACTP